MYSISTTTCEYVGSSTNCITESPYFNNGDILIILFLFLIFTILFFTNILNLLKK